VFYIGKGTGNRAFAHLMEAPGARKTKRIRAIQRARLQPRIDILATDWTRTLLTN